MNHRTGSSAYQSKLSVIIPVHNGGEAFHWCLKSLQTSWRQPDEVIVVADGDTDGSWQVAQSFGAKVFRYESQGGAARARNCGAAMARGEILCFVDADVTLAPETLGKIEAAFQHDSMLDALIGSYDDNPGAQNFLSQYKNLFHHYTHQTSSEDACTFWGACGAVRRSVFESVGGFDESWRNCVEDIELGYRLKRAGFRIRLYKDIQVKHLKRWQPVSLLKAEIFYRALPWTKLICRDRYFNADLNLNHTNRLSVLFAFGLLICLVICPLIPHFFLLAIPLATGLIIINRKVYQFFHQKRGLLFTLRTIPWHWLYFVYGGASFAFGCLRYSLGSFNTLSLAPTNKR